MFVVGGAAIAVAYDTARRTRDVDAVFSDSAETYEAARVVARRMGLPRDWLNVTVRSYLIGPDDDRVRLLESGSLSVAVGSAPYVLALKMLAGRVEQDHGDIRLLYRVLGLQSWEDGVDVLERYLPADDVPLDAIELLQAMFPPRSELLGPDTDHRRRDPVGRCRVCGRALRSPTSRAAGVGPKCSERAP